MGVNVYSERYRLETKEFFRSYTCGPMTKPLSLRCVMLCAVVIFSTGFSSAQSQSTKTMGPMLLVANQHSHDLSLIDPKAGKQIATVPVEGVTGHEVAASPDGKLAYVPIYGDAGVGRAGTDGSTMSVIDLARRARSCIRSILGMECGRIARSTTRTAECCT